MNNWTAHWTADFMDRVGERVVAAKKSKLIESYSKLDQPAPKPTKRLTEQEAAEVMWTYYRANRATLPSWIIECREVILELLLKGLSVEKAFAQAVSFHGGKQ